jgi:RNA polymerase-binding protein DksA
VALHGVYGDRLKVSLTAPPEDSRANRQLEETLALRLGLRRADVRVETGHASRDKVVAFSGITDALLRTKLGALLGEGGPPDKDDPVDRKALKNRLLKERERLEQEIADLDADLAKSLEDTSGESPYDQHMAEAAAATLDREMDLTRQENARAELVQVEQAIRKLDNGTYGLCDKCGKPIGEGRLSVAPYATLCIDCKRLEERTR